MEAKTKRFFLSPWTVMAVTGIMYVAKWLSKMEVGAWVNSPALIADGFHNLADLIEVGLVMFFGVYLGNKPRSGKYPMGRKRIESFLVLIISMALFWLTYDTFTKSFSGLISLYQPLDQPLRAFLPSFIFPEVKPQLLTGNAFVAVGLTASLSAVISMTIGRYEIASGKKAGMMSMVADGQETLSDGRVEIGSAIGFSLKFGLIFLLGERFPSTIPLIGSVIEYSLGLIVAYMVMRTGIEMLSNSLKVLIALSIGEDKVQAIRDLLARIEGIKDVKELITFSDGTTATCILTVGTKASSKAHGPLHRTIERRIKQYLAQFDDFLNQEVWVSFVRPTFELLREAQAIIIENGDEEMNAPTLADATHLRIYDKNQDGKRQRAVDVPLAGMTLPDIVKKLEDKGVQSVAVFIGNDTERRAIEVVNIRYELTHTLRVYVPSKVRAVV